jgi:hypothetical protein
MSPIRTTLLAAAAALASLAATAEGPASALSVERAWARATPPGTAVAAAYLVIDNRGGTADRLLSVSTPRAGQAEVHATVRDMDIVRMRRIDPLHVGAGERVTFDPGGTHIMLMGLKSPLLEGERLPLELKFERAGTVRVEAEVRAATATDPHAGHHQH